MTSIPNDRAPAHFTPIQRQLLWLTVRRAEVLGQDPAAYVQELTHIGTADDRETVAAYLDDQAQPELPVIPPHPGVMADLRRYAAEGRNVYGFAWGVIAAIVSRSVWASDADKLAEIRGVMAAADVLRAQPHPEHGLGSRPHDRTPDCVPGCDDMRCPTGVHVWLEDCPPEANCLRGGAQQHDENRQHGPGALPHSYLADHCVDGCAEDRPEHGPTAWPHAEEPECDGECDNGECFKGVDHGRCDGRCFDHPVPFDPGTGPVSGYVAGMCGHRVARSEWLAGFRVCEPCSSDGVR